MPGMTNSPQFSSFLSFLRVLCGKFAFTALEKKLNSLYTVVKNPKLWNGIVFVKDGSQGFFYQRF